MSGLGEAVIRTGTAADVAAVLAVWAASDAVPSITDTAAHLDALLARDADALLVAESGVEVIGSLIVGWDGWRANFYRLAVAPSWRRRGIATALVAEGEAHLRRLGAVRLTALVVEAELHAMAFWQSAGYEVDWRILRFVRTVR